MDALRLKIDLSGLADKIAERLSTLANPEYLLRPVAFDLVALMTERIHDKGQASDGSQIGTYSSGYMAVRQAKYKRTADTKVIISLTRQLENDWSVIKSGNGYGVGFKNKHNYDKSGWVENTYKKPIFSLSQAEREYAQKRFAELIDEQLK